MASLKQNRSEKGNYYTGLWPGTQPSLSNTLSTVALGMAATWFPSLVLTQPFKAAWPPVPITKVCSWNQAKKKRKERTNAFLFWINKTGKAIKSQQWDLFTINYCSSMRPHCEHTCMCCSHVPPCEDRMPCAHAWCTQMPLFFTHLVLCFFLIYEFGKKPQMDSGVFKCVVITNY